LRLFSFGGYGLALAALALMVFGAYDSYPNLQYLLQQQKILLQHFAFLRKKRRFRSRLFIIKL